MQRRALEAREVLQRFLGAHVEPCGGDSVKCVAVASTHRHYPHLQAHWILPGPRELEASIFGTPDVPLGFATDEGVPLEARLSNDDGTAYTTTAGPTPHSDWSAPMRASSQMSLDDITAVDSPASRDRVQLTAEFTDPNGDGYRLVVDRVVPQGPTHPYFGGVVANAYLHGTTGIGTKLQPL